MRRRDLAFNNRLSLGSSPEPTVMGLALDEAGAPAAPTFNDPDLPAVSGGGFDYVYAAPTTATVPSSAAAIQAGASAAWPTSWPGSASTHRPD